MWLLNWVPSWLFSLVFFLGLVAYLVANSLKVLPYRPVIKIGGIAAVFLSVYLLGVQYADQVWQQRSRDLQLKVKELEVKSQEENVKVVERVVTKQQVVKERGQDIIKYVDREVVKNEEVIKYIEQCPKLPSEVVNTINKAAKP